MEDKENGRHLSWVKETRRFLRQPELNAIVPGPTLKAALSCHTWRSVTSSCLGGEGGGSNQQ